MSGSFETRVFIFNSNNPGDRLVLQIRKAGLILCINYDNTSTQYQLRLVKYVNEHRLINQC